MPRNFAAFAAYIWRKNPRLWCLFAAQDAVHFTRYPLSFIFLGRIIDILRRSQAGHGLPPAVYPYIGGLFAILSIGELAHIWTSHIIIHWKPKLRAAIRADFLSYTMGHGHAYFQDNFAGALARKVSEVAESTLRLHDIVRFQLLFGVVQFATSLTFMFATNWIYGLALAVFIVAILSPVILRLPRIRARSLAFSEQRASVSGTVVDILTNIPAIKSHAASRHEERVHSGVSAAEVRHGSKLLRNMIQMEDLRRVCLSLLGGGMTLLTCFGWSRGWITVGQASTIATLAMTLTGVAWMFGTGILQFTDEAGSINDALRITARPHDIVDRPGAIPLILAGGRIHFNQVTFGYPGHDIFRDLELDIRPGEKIALVGPSGAGKSTLVSLLLRLFDVQAGAIEIDGQDIAGVTQESLRRAIAVIPQDTALFHRGLLENIRYGRQEATEAEVREAARRAHAHEFIDGLPLGYGTMVGERGIRLSGGQRQRVAIARAILKDAPILVLDEATSALDSESERLIQVALADLMTGKTVIAIAHRLSTIASMDRIIVLEQGRIAEQGNHRSLVAAGGLYARLWAMQSGGFLAEDAAGGPVG